MLMVFTWHGLSRSVGESLPPTILLVATSISQTPVVSISSDHKLEIQSKPDFLENINEIVAWPNTSVS